MGIFIDLRGQRFGRLTVIERAANHKKQTVWACKCDCGNTQEVQGGHLRGGKIISCGCYQTENNRRKATRHGRCGSKLHRIWLAMRQRCNNPKCKDYVNYGARGISVCDAWSDFSVFESWALSNGYEEGLTIERVNVLKGYHPDNCTWIPRCEQNKNTRRTRNNRPLLEGRASP